MPNLLINNAGICIKGSSSDVFQQTLDVNFYGALRVIRALSPAMRQRGSSHVINISSGEGELVYLCSRLQKDIPLATSVEQLTSLLEGCLKLVRSSHAHQPNMQNVFLVASQASCSVSPPTLID